MFKRNQELFFSSIPLSLIFLFGPACSSDGDDETIPATDGGTAAPQPTMADCNSWMRANHVVDYPNHDCTKFATILNELEANQAAAIPVGTNRFFIVWFPQNWEQIQNQKLITIIHGSEACAEGRFDNWFDFSDDYALVALQYAENESAVDPTYDSADTIYENLGSTFEQLEQNCPIQNATVIYDGFSRGAAFSFQIALKDVDQSGMHKFTSFIADSGSGITDPNNLPFYFDNVDYMGSRFWLYCANNTAEGLSCSKMEFTKDLLPQNNAQVDAYYVDDGGYHGIFYGHTAGQPDDAINALMNYVQSL